MNSSVANNSDSVPWKASENCERINVGNYFFRRISNDTFEVMNNPSGFNSEIVDSNVSYAIGNDGNLYKYDYSTNNFALFYTPSSPFPTNNKTSITVYSDRIFINSTSTTSV